VIPEPPEEELREIYDRVAPALCRHLAQLTGSEAEAWDLFQKAVVKYWQVRRGGRSVQNRMAFLWSVSTRYALRSMQRWGWRRRPEDELPEPCTVIPEESLDLIEGARRCWRFLDPKGRVVLKALVVDGLTPGEIETYLGLRRATIQRKIKRIRRLAAKIRRQPPGGGEKK
jgi:RNA polymerase sigma factor (sigma-70 family)